MHTYPIIGTRKGNMLSLYLKGISVAVFIILILSYFNILPLTKLLDQWVLTYILVIVGLPLLIASIKYADKKPMVIVDRYGLSIRKSRIPFSKLQQIDWSDISGFTVDVIESRYSETCFMTITTKSTSKKYYVDLYDLDTGEEVLSAVEKNVNIQSKSFLQ